MVYPSTRQIFVVLNITKCQVQWGQTFYWVKSRLQTRNNCLLLNFSCWSTLKCFHSVKILLNRPPKVLDIQHIKGLCIYDATSNWFWNYCDAPRCKKDCPSANNRPSVKSHKYSKKRSNWGANKEQPKL